MGIDTTTHGFRGKLLNILKSPDSVTFTFFFSLRSNGAEPLSASVSLPLVSSWRSVLLSLE